MTSLTQLEPSLLWRWFAQICSVPHPSYYEKKLASYIINWAKQQKLWVAQDEAGNILIRKAATNGKPDSVSVVLQAHIDMVPQKEDDMSHNFLTDPIDAYIDGEWVTARGTTLGADNGIGLASTLAVLEANNLRHPPLEVLLTVSEETGMEGALHLKPDWLKSQLMINTDSETDAAICIGCAGGVDCDISLPIQLEDNQNNNTVQITLTGAKGGHSGLNIHEGRANTIKLMIRILRSLSSNLDFNISLIQGGSARNAIPRTTTVLISVEQKNISSLHNNLQNIFQEIKQEYELIEPDLSLEIQSAPARKTVLTKTSQTRLLNLINAMPNAVQRMSNALLDVVETSLNLSELNISDEEANIQLLIRSLIESGKQAVISKIISLCELAQATAKFSGNYPGWKPEKSTLLELAEITIQKVLNKKVPVYVIHAGLECGLIKSKYPKLDIISIGMTIENAHSPDEKVNIESVKNYWNILISLLAEL